MVRLPDPVLQARALEVVDFDDDLLALAEDLVDTMRASPACVGLAANQIGASRRVFVVDVSGHPKARSCAGELVVVNPEIVEATSPAAAREGCMSVPDLTGDVARATKVVLRGRSPEGTELVVESDAFEARALLHELDHLDGLVFLDRVASPTSVFRRRVYR